MRTFITPLLCVVVIVFLSACPKGGGIVFGPKGPNIPGVYLNKDWRTPVRVVKELEMKTVQVEGLDIDLVTTKVWDTQVIDMEATFRIHSDSVIHPDREGKFDLYFFPGSEWYSFSGGLDTSTAEAFITNRRSSEGIQVLYIGELNMGSQNNPVPVSKFTGYVTKNGRYLIDLPEGGRLLVEW